MVGHSSMRKALVDSKRHSFDNAIGQDDTVSGVYAQEFQKASRMRHMSGHLRVLQYHVVEP